MIKFPLKHDCIHNNISDNHQLIIQKEFLEENYLLRINCVKLIEVNDNRYFLWVQWFNVIEMLCRIAKGKSNEVDGCGHNEYLLSYDKCYCKLSVKILSDI
jgi:hypothetical protein